MAKKNTNSSNGVAYTEDSIRTLEPREHIRLRPGMYIGKLGDGSSQEDGIYILLKEVIDNAIDEHLMGYGNRIEVTIEDRRVRVRDYGRGIPLGKVIDCVSKINTGGKYDSSVFQKSIGLNGVGTKAVNALSTYFMVQSVREGKTKIAEFERGVLVKDHPVKPCDEPDGTLVVFEPDETIFKHFKFIPQFVENLLWNYAFLNAGLTLVYNGKEFHSKDGLLDLLRHKVNEEEIRYPIIHLKGKDIEIAMTHGSQYGEDYYSFVNGQYTSQGGTHQQAFREAVVKTVRDFYKKDFDTTDIRASIVAAISIRVQEPVFESQTKTKLGSTNLSPDPNSPTIRTFILDFVKTELDNYLHQHPETAEALLKRIQQSEKERKEIAGIRKLAKERVKKASLHNSKLRDCRIHFNDTNKDERYETTIFITEGDSASGSMTKARDVRTQAVFSLRGKPLNCWNASKKVVYENEELNLLHHALGLDDGLEGLRYNRVVIATDADTDGMHIRLLLLTFFLRFYPDLVRHGHVYILDTPLFRVRNKKQTIYCYSEQEKIQAVEKLGKGVEITRFKGLGEISPEEFKQFIGEDMRLEPVILQEHTNIEKLLSYYMGSNTTDRQEFIINNLRIETDMLDPSLAERVELEA
ncbi:MAG: DNA topoisomerase (ATP-hydrolyzing) [Thermonema sp.]|uniref:DNA topoisomerase IV subunit B n=1 Tax=Thermonema sp. TaxID=2231181 RepID=UPI0021DE1496|nr:DNA topoisomerase IV subunit B [Thermonema sp.]GIV40661.1 MAG: DNA topoisomerase (ATP-hydrolyzing) [Thermonema sp.]